MEKFRSKIRRDALIACIYCVLLVATLITLAIVGIDDIATSYALGFGSGIGAVVVYHLISYIRALKDETKLKTLYIKENDERTRHIDAKVGGIGMNIAILTFAIGMLIANYFNEMVFYTLLAAMLFLAILKIVLGRYYTQKL